MGCIIVFFMLFTFVINLLEIQTIIITCDYRDQVNLVNTPTLSSRRHDNVRDLVNGSKRAQDTFTSNPTM